MTKGRSIRLFLADGTPGGIITAEIMNWTGHVMNAPRSRLADLIQRPEAGRTGIYILSGTDPDGGYKPLVYVGETDSVGKRLAQHNKDEAKEFWEQTCVVTSKDQNLTKAHARYLESRLIAIATEAGRVKLTNSTAPELPLLPEADVSDMEYFIEQLRVVLPVLGLDVLKDTSLRRPTEAGMPVTSKPGPRESGHRAVRQGALDLGHELFNRSSAQEVFYGLPPSLPTGDESPDMGGEDVFELRDRKSGGCAYAYETESEFVVVTGSFARADSPDSFNSYRNLRQSLKDDGTLRPNDGCFVFTRDTAFRSPSAASAVILDRNDNGRTSWRLKGKRGTTYADWQEAQIAAVTPAEAEE